MVKWPNRENERGGKEFIKTFEWGLMRILLT